MAAPLLSKPSYQEVGWHTKNNLVIDRVNALRNVEDTADADKPISDATQEALDAKSDADHTHSYPVTSVAGKTGSVTLAKGDVGLGNVDNTSDSSKPISTLTQAALDLKSDDDHTHSYAASTHTHAQSDITGLSSALAGKASTTDMDAAEARLDVIQQPNVSLTDATTVAINAALGNKFKVTLGGSRTLGNPSNAYDGQVLLITVKQDGTGGRTVTLGNKYRLPAGVTLTWSSGAGDIDKLLVQYDSVDDTFDVLAFQAGY